MANFAGILSLKANLRLHSGLFSVHLLKKSGVVCSRRREYGSPFPVKYIPKKASGSNRKERYSPVELPEENGARAARFGKSISDNGWSNEVVSSNKELRDLIDRRNPMKGPVIGSSSFPEKGAIKPKDGVSMNDGVTGSSYWDMEDQYDQEAEDFMKPAAELVEEIDTDKNNIIKQDTLSNDRTRKEAEEFAIKLLGKRAYTAAEMRKKMGQKRFDAAMVDSVLSDFQKRGFINDTLYAEMFSRSRWSSSSWGPGRIKQELLRKGVRTADVDNAVRQIFEGDVDCTSHGGSRLVLSRDALDRLFVQASKQWLRSEGVTLETRKSRIIRWLQYRGFNWGVTSLILKRLESQESS
ncbi:hypothetical protein SAY86_016443 [Trapa natans]|uniref:Regulatory protein RecX n=1 Tax=Trapa natans TaxID=22666 RepID=A0AAN7QZG6_TRANT|nr:hypothetical protein SAY86_016443 [Trapa natans]